MRGVSWLLRVLGRSVFRQSCRAANDGGPMLPRSAQANGETTIAQRLAVVDDHHLRFTSCTAIRHMIGYALAIQLRHGGDDHQRCCAFLCLSGLAFSSSACKARQALLARK